MKFASLIALVAAVSAVRITEDPKNGPLPEQPNQYSRVCDAVAPANKNGCKVQVKRVCDAANPQHGCEESLNYRGNNMDQK